MVNILTGTPFDKEPRFNRRTDEVSLEFPSSAGSRARGLLGLRAINWRAIGGEDVKTVKVTIGNASANMHLWAVEIERLAAEAGVKNGIVWYSGPDTTRYNLPVACAIIDGSVVGNWSSNALSSSLFGAYRYRNGALKVPIATNYDAASTVGDEYTIAPVDCPWFA